MPDEFVIRAALAGIGVAFASGPLGCFVIWRRMAYFGDATSHAAILGIALSFAFSLSISVGVLAVALATALAVSALSGRMFAADTLLGVFTHGALAAGLVAIALVAPRSINIEAYLFGEILAVTRSDLAVIWGGAALVLLLIGSRWNALLTATLSPDLARADGILPRTEQTLLTVALAVVVAVSIRAVGALLITAMLIIPAAAARPFARTPEAMAVLAALAGCTAVLAGLAGSWHWDTPAGPTIVVAATALFAASVGFRRSRS